MSDEHQCRRSKTRREVLTGVGGVTAGITLSGTVAGIARPRSADDAGQQQRDSAAAEGDDHQREIASIVEDLLEDADVPGAAVAVVVDDEVVLSEGYGLADSETGLPAEPTTPFRIASVSKPVVCTAIAELIARGNLDPETPVQEYIDNGLVNWDEPVTLANLAAHTGGFEATNHNMWFPSPEDVGPLPEHLDPMPAQVRSPGTLGSYSNHGIALAGQSLAEAAGDPFAEAMAAVLFEPAGMETSSFAQPLPSAIDEVHATGEGGIGAAGRFGGLGISPAGAMSASATDMARFMLLHLNEGRLDGEQVLDPAAIDHSHQQWFTHHEAISGMAFGFAESRHGDTRVLRHDGASPASGFTSELRLAPEHDIGVFTAYNDNGLELDLADTVVEALLPDPSHESPNPSDPHRAEELPGSYRSIRHGTQAHDSLFTTTLNAPSIDVALADDGALLVDDGGGATRWVEIEPLVFEREDGSDRLAFGEDDDGELSQLFLGGTPSAFVETSWYQSTTLHGGALIGSLFGLGWAYNEYKPDRNREESRREWLASTRSDPDRLSSLMAHLGSGTFLAFLLLLLGYMTVGQTQYLVGYLTDPSSAFLLAYALPVIGVATTVGTVALALYTLLTRCWSPRRQLLYTLTALVLLGTATFLWYWNLLLL
ncbi:serine hydrolase domain-containing protein [Natronorubrum sulfidifaciens]|uniref:serine hydrolase domain-containing protein n=1 Tax=Natronorubrum sulfidifaciens TaxID=388259 RepID=UPI000A03E279|nr:MULTISPECIES: serine hydrolase domain-containing protein [Halobacteria]